MLCNSLYEIILISPNFTTDTSVVPSNCSDGDVRLNRYGRTDLPEGRVQVCVNRVWGSVCYSTSTYSYLQSRTSNTWDVGDTEVVCRQLGYQALGESRIIHFKRYSCHFTDVWQYVCTNFKYFFPRLHVKIIQH